MTFLEAFKKEEFQPLLRKLTHYAAQRLSGLDDKQRGGVQPVDLVADALRKAVDGTRKWDPSESTVREFLFGCVRSEISSFFKKLKKVPTSFQFEEAFIDSSIENEEERDRALRKLKAEGADQEELEVFEVLISGTTKPAQIAEDLEISVDDVYIIMRRLRRRLDKIATTTII
jgi:DNA-directed RNA polymerase specialized sigma24 family protein